MSKLRVLYLGQKPIGRNCFDRLLARRDAIEIVGVVSNTGFGNWWRNRSIADLCSVEGIPLIPNERRDASAIGAMIRDHCVDVLLSVQHPWILPAGLLEAVGGRAFNLHLAKLPEYKGWHACSHALLNGDAHFTSTIHWMVPEVDSGAIAYEESFPIAPSDTARSLYTRAEAAGLRLFDQLLDDLVGGRLPSRRLPTGVARFYDRTALDPLRGVDPGADPALLDLRARAFFFPPFEPAYIRWHDNKIYLLPHESRAENARCSW